MLESEFEDYYQVLQVHYDASPEVIQAAYKRLSRIYHPDNYNNANQDFRMSRINQAYSILSDTTLRKNYHRKWLAFRTDRRQYVQNIRCRFDQAHPSYDILNDFFYSMKTKNWDAAYLDLTEEDKSRYTVEDFRAWKEAVDSCYEMQEYKIKFFRTYYNCKVNDIVYKSVMEYAVYVTDMNRQTLEIETETLHKYTAYDGVSWKVTLGVSSLKYLTLKFRLLADRRENFDPMHLYHSAVSHNDPLTGLLSEIGFFEESSKEEIRNRRYQNPFSLIAFNIIYDDPEQEADCLCHCASIIRSNIRINDIAGRLNNNKLICLLAETTLENAQLTAVKFENLFNKADHTAYTVQIGIVEYLRFTSLEEAVFAACSHSNLYNNTLQFSSSE